jgi:apolipoprotein N-acyltransferase
MFGLSGATAGDGPRCFSVDGVNVAPNICFESMMPRVISRQVRQLAARGCPPDVLVNVTNDSWFRGSALLEHHLACSVLCAVENRLPMLVAANSGISAAIDGCGRIVQSTQKFAVDGIWARPKADSRRGLVQVAGYPLGWICLLGVGLALLWPARRTPQARSADRV